MPEPTIPTDVPVLAWKDLRTRPRATDPAAEPAGPRATERLARATWLQYHAARLAEAQFGPDSLEASIAHSRALTSYRELRHSRPTVIASSDCTPSSSHSNGSGPRTTHG